MMTDKYEQGKKRYFSKELLHSTSTAVSTQCYTVCSKSHNAEIICRFPF